MEKKVNNEVKKEIIKIKEKFYKINSSFNRIIKDENFINKKNYASLIEKLKMLIVLISNKLLELEEVIEKDLKIDKEEINDINTKLLILNNYYNLIYQYKYCN